ncbi:MAG: class I SAM-dependent methyltransferase [Pseudomonadota bacterium]
MTGKQTELDVPIELRRGRHRGDEKTSVASAVKILRYLAEHLGLRDFGATDMLDMGCGVKFTQAFLNEKLPIRKYVGIDLYPEMINFLKDTVTDSRFSYGHANIHNEMYNPDGRPLARFEELPVGEQRFDVIALLSVFTHLEPTDYVSMLRLLRKYVKPEGRLVYSLFIDEITERGFGLIDTYQKMLERRFAVAAPPPELERVVAPFRDLDPSQPLKWALYSEAHARELIANTGWEIVSLTPPPDSWLQHHFLLRPC